MANKRSSISANLRADASGWVKGCHQANAAVKKLKQDVEATKINTPSMKWTEFKAKADTAAAALRAVGSALASPANANIWIDDMQDGLAAVMGSSDAAHDHLQKLLTIANEQSLSDDQFQKIVEYSERLQSTGTSAEEALVTVRELANAAEAIGKGVEELDAMVSAMDKMDQSGEATLKTIIALTKQTPALRVVLQNAFGTTSAAEIEKMKLSTDELIGALRRGMQMMPTARPDNTEALMSMTERTRLQQVNKMPSFFKENPIGERKEMTDEEARLARETEAKAIAEREATRAADAHLKIRREHLDTLRDQGQQDQAAYDLSIAQANQDQTAVDQAEAQLETERRLNDLKKSGVEIDKDLLRILARQQALRVADAAAIRAANAAKRAGEEQRQLDIDKLRQRGKDRKANKMEDKAAIDQMVKDGTDPAVAADLVRQRRQLEDDTRLGPGRRRIRGIDQRPVPGGTPERNVIPIPDSFREKPKAPSKSPDGKPTDLSAPLTDALKNVLSIMTKVEQNTRKTAAEQQTGIQKAS